MCLEHFEALRHGTILGLFFHRLESKHLSRLTVCALCSCPQLAMRKAGKGA
jgi:hypothetical protein